MSGPVPLPTKKEVVTILRAVHKYKDSREQFEQRTHKRLIDITAPSQKTVDALSRLEMPAGVYIDIKMKTKLERPQGNLFSRKKCLYPEGFKYRSNTAFPVEESTYRQAVHSVPRILGCSRMNAKAFRCRS